MVVAPLLEANAAQLIQFVGDIIFNLVSNYPQLRNYQVKTGVKHN